jgi:NSS family neurotransmitter:Na+ symporter
MLPFRPRWPDRIGVIVAIAGMGLGMLLCRPEASWPVGPALVSWLVALLVVAIPFAVLELGTGAIYQDSLAESCRKASKPAEVVGWLAAGTALVAMVLITLTAGRIGEAAYDSLLAAIGDQPSPWVADADKLVAPHAGGGLLAVAAVLGLAQFRLWRGASAIAKSSALLTVVGGTGLMLISGVLLLHPGAMDGLVRLLAPGPAGWQVLATPEPWVAAFTTVLVGWGIGTGALTAYGSYLNRSSDAIGIAVIAILVGSSGQVLLMAAVSVGSGVIFAGRPSDGGIDAVAAALANVGLPAWWAGVLLTVWFSALLALLIPALLAMAEAVVAPLVDKFRVPRERVVPAIGLGLFFLAALLHGKQDATTWCVQGLVWSMAISAMAQALVSWRAIKLDAVARHLNAYSAFRLRLGWRSAVALVVPLSALGLLAWMVLAGRDSILAGAILAAGLALVAVVAARLPGRG